MVHGKPAHIQIVIQIAIDCRWRNCPRTRQAYIKATVRLLVSWFLPSLMVQKILWPEIGVDQGLVHATEKLENHENDKENWFLSTLALQIDQGSSLRESLKDTWLVETVETDNKAAA